MDHFSLQTL